MSELRLLAPGLCGGTGLVAGVPSLTGVDWRSSASLGGASVGGGGATIDRDGASVCRNGVSMGRGGGFVDWVGLSTGRGGF